VFGLWQPDPHGGAEQTDVPGSIWWIEVLARDPAIARDFYGQLFGWNARDTSFEPFAAYTVFERPGNQEAGLLPGDVDPRLVGADSRRDVSDHGAHVRDVVGPAFLDGNIPAPVHRVERSDDEPLGRGDRLEFCPCAGVEPNTTTTAVTRFRKRMGNAEIMEEPQRHRLLQ